MSSSLLIVVLVVVWLFVLAPMAIRSRKPIRRTGDGLAQTRTLHAGGGRRLQPRRGRASLVDDAAEPEDMELFGLPSGAGCTDAELVEAESWLARLAEDRERHLADSRGRRRGLAADRVPTAARAAAEDVTAGATGESHRAGIAALAQPLRDTAAGGSTGAAAAAREPHTTLGDSTSAESAARKSRVEVTAVAVEASAERTADHGGSLPRAVDAEELDALDESSTFVVDGEVFERPEAEPEPTPRERRAAEHAARAAEREAQRPHAPELDEKDYDFVDRRRGRGVYDPRADRRAAAARAVRRQRTALGLVGVTALFAVLAVLVAPALWAGAAIGVGLLVAYLAYLRKQVRMEQTLRARRMERLRRARLGVESREDAELSVVPQRLRRPGSVVLEIDDEDPVFDHLASPQAARGARVERGASRGPVGAPAQRAQRENRQGPSRRAV